MAYFATAAANLSAFVDALATFAAANGWTVNYSENGAPDGKQLGLSSGACKVAIGEESSAHNPYMIGNPAVQDAALNMVVVKEFTAAKNYWSHNRPGVNGAVQKVSGHHTVISDLLGPMTDVRFFGNADYIFAFMRTSPARWSMLGFGVLERDGAIDIPFCGGTNYFFWTFGNNDISQKIGSTNHRLMYGGYYGGLNAAGNGLQAFVPAGVLDPAFGWSAGDVFLPTASEVSIDRVMPSFNASTLAPRQNGWAVGSMLDPIWSTDPQPTTGGMPLMALPIVAAKAGQPIITTFLGTVPAIRLCRNASITPGGSVFYGDEEFQVFPVKMRGVASDTYWGGVSNGLGNSLDLSWAIKK